MKLGYLGLGNMGAALARRLLRTHPLHVYDIDEAAATALAVDGAHVCASPSELAALCDIVLTCVPDSSSVRRAIFGTDGLASGMAPGGMIIDQTTGDPLETRRMAADLAGRRLELIDAPVSGGPPGAAAGTIAVMVGASEAQYRRVEPILRAISSNVFHAGDVGSGHVMKLANNMLAAAQRLLSFEAVCLAAKNGVAPAKAVEIMTKGSGRNYTLEQTFPRHILTGELFQGFTLSLMHKDVALATKLGSESNVPMFLGGLVRELYQSIISEMGREAQVNSAALVFDRLCGTCVVPRPPETYGERT